MRYLQILWILPVLLASAVMAQERGLLKKVRLSSGQEMELYSRSYALVVGVQSYQHWDRLINPVRDAHEVGEKLAQQGFEVTYLDDPDSEQLKAGLNAFAYGPGGRDEEARVVIFFAGHGHTEKIASGQRGFIVPRDAPYPPEQDMVDFMAKAVSMDDIEQWATGMLAKHVLFVFDSCFSGTLLRGTAHPELITEKTTQKVRQFITSGSANEQVPDESVFKASFLNALNGDADKTGDGYVTGEELGWYLKGRVMEYTHGSQTPQYGKIKDPNLDQGDIVFVLETPDVVSPLPPPAPEPITPPPPAAVQFGHLQVNVNAANSRVSVNGTYRGMASPRQALELSNLDLGTVTVRVAAPGHEEWTERTTLKANEWTVVVAKLTPVVVAPPPVKTEPVHPTPSQPSTAGRQAGEERTFTLPGGASIEMVWISAGTFTMGTAEAHKQALQSGKLWADWMSREQPGHEVTLSRGFWLGKYELTQGQWEGVMGTNPWSGQNYVQANPSHPAVFISWEDVQELVGKLNQAEGRTVYRLPTEAEWEYACRAGTSTVWPFGNDASSLGNYAWYDKNAWDVGKQYAQPVGQKRGSPWGLHDMLGNVYEWCQDWYGDYSNGSQTDPTGPSSGSDRVNRGGIFRGDARIARPAIRHYYSPSSRGSSLGARLLRTP